MNITVVSLYTKGYLPDHLIEKIRANHQRYCDRHGYRYRCYDQSLDLARAAPWSKLKAVLENLDNNYVVWLDFDAIITNPEITFESIIKQHPRSQLVLCQDQAPWIGTPDWVNTGVMIFQDSEWTKEFIQAWYDWDYPEAHNSGFWEQDTFLRMYFAMSSKYYRARSITIIPQTTMNCYRCNWRGDSFVLHLAGEKDKTIIESFLNRLI